MVKHLFIFSALLLIIGSCAHSSQENQQSDFQLIRDNLYVDDTGNLYLKSKTKEHFETGDWMDVWLTTVYCDSCWTNTDEGWIVTTLNDFVDTATFHLVTTHITSDGDFYEDANYYYFHKAMADGGTITVMDK